MTVPDLLPMFQVDIHEAWGVDGNLVGREHEFPVRATHRYEAYDNTDATEEAIQYMRAWAHPGDIGRLYRLDDETWHLLTEIRHDHLR